MLKRIFSKILLPRNEKYLNELRREIPKINEFYTKFKSFTDEEILSHSLSIKEDIQKQINEEKNIEKIALRREKILKKYLPEVFGLIKEVVFREFKIELYDVQLLGGMVLHFGNIAEMKTGEGKTYTAMLPAYLNALTGKQIHIVTVNDYLAKRDSEKVSVVFEKLGLTVGCNVIEEKGSLLNIRRKEEYEKDIIYGTSNNFGFDYLRDNSVKKIEDKVMKDRFFAIVDEVDSVLIDEARTPLIISSEDNLNQNELNLLNLARDIVKELEVGDIIEADTPADALVLKERETGDFKLDLKSKTVIFTENGMNKIVGKLKENNVIEDENELYLPENLKLFNLIQIAGNAQYAFIKNKDYLIKNGEIKIIDEMTGRVQEDRKWSNGLHQAIEAKENVKVTPQSKTIATTTLQHYFNKYDKISGMTGTADTEANEFYYVYGLETFVVPTNKKIQRVDYPDRIFLTKKRRDEEFVKIVKEEHANGRPILIGTNSVKENEFYSNLLNKNGIKHEVLNAKNHYKEAEIIANAGKIGAVTLATNMAGRGTDIILGGNFASIKNNLAENIYHSNQYISNKIKEIEENEKKQYEDVISKKGLLVISIGRNESRRVDNQLRGRSGRQGDVGNSIFLVSLDDDIFKPFGIEKVKNFALNIGKNEDFELSGKMFNKRITQIQTKIEEFHFEARKNIMKFAESTDKQTDMIYKLRDEILKINDRNEFEEITKENLNDMLEEELNLYIPKQSFEEMWDIKGLEKFLKQQNIDLDINEWLEENTKKHTTVDFDEKLKNDIRKIFEDRLEKVLFLMPEETFINTIKSIYIDVLDENWTEHLSELQYIREVVGLKGYSGKDPKEIFKKEAYELFEFLIRKIKKETILKILKLRENQVINV